MNTQMTAWQTSPFPCESEILIMYRGDKLTTRRVRVDAEGFIYSWSGQALPESDNAEITHWMPLPDSLKENKSEDDEK